MVNTMLGGSAKCVDSETIKGALKSVWRPDYVRLRKGRRPPTGLAIAQTGGKGNRWIQPRLGYPIRLHKPHENH